MIVALCGHSRVDGQRNVEDWLTMVIRQLICEGAKEFYLGGYGEFDAMAHRVIQKQQKIYPSIQCILVLAYLNREGDCIKRYDGSIYPPLENVPPRYAIAHRNRWMVEQCDILVAYVTHLWGGAAQTMEYAQKKGKRIEQYTT